MNCRKCNDDLTAYLDEELPSPIAEEMKRHLDACPPCRDEYRNLKASMDLISTHAKQIDPAPELWHMVRARVADMPAPGASLGFFRFLVLNRWATALGTMAATVLLAVGVWGYLDHRHSQNELESYMNDYIRMRTVSEKLHGQLAEPASWMEVGPGALENPFAEIRPVSLDNPFRAEER